MKPAERIPLLKKLATALSDEETPWAEIGLTLRQFGFTSEDKRRWDEWGMLSGPNQYEVVLGHLESSGDDDALLELERYLDPADNSPAAAPASLGPGPWAGEDTFRLFISHTHPNATFAGVMKTFLGKYRIECFVAHADIEPSEKWMDVIRSALLTCHALTALVTDDFRQSQWCDQEVGFALARSLVVVPLMRDAPPHGFLSEFQAIKLTKGSTGSSAAADVFNILAKHKETRDRMAGPVVRRYSKSASFESTRKAYAQLSRIPKAAWTPELVREARGAEFKNNQVEHANLKDGTPVPEATKKLLAPVEAKLGIDGEIPF